MVMNAHSTWWLGLLAFGLVGCSSTQTYSVRPRVLDGEDVKVRVQLSAEQLSTRTTAGRYMVQGVTLRLADGTELEPTFAARTTESRRVSSGGARIGTGFGVGSDSGVGVGTGVSVPVGDTYDDVVFTLVWEARWDQPPLDRQPFTAVVSLATEPVTVVEVPLGELDDIAAPPADSDAQRIETWELPDGTARRFAVYEDGQGVRYEALDEAE